MSLLNRLRRATKDTDPKNPDAGMVKKAAVKPESKRDEAVKGTTAERPSDGEKTASSAVQKSGTGDASDNSIQYAHRVLLRPVISEKSTMLHSHNQYVFMVDPRANKVEIKRAIKEVYRAEPLRVRVVKMSGKTVTRGRFVGTTRSFKKAIVTMPKGVELPVYEGT